MGRRKVADEIVEEEATTENMTFEVDTWVEATEEQARAAQEAGILAGYDPIKGLILVTKGEADA